MAVEAECVLERELVIGETVDIGGEAGQVRLVDAGSGPRLEQHLVCGSASADSKMHRLDACYVKLRALPGRPQLWVAGRLDVDRVQPAVDEALGVRQALLRLPWLTPMADAIGAKACSVWRAYSREQHRHGVQCQVRSSTSPTEDPEPPISADVVVSPQMRNLCTIGRPR